MFGRITPTYDRLNRLFSGFLDQRWRRRAARDLCMGLAPCCSVLDVAAGTGDLSLAVRRVAGARVTGADFARPMLARALTKLGSRDYSWVEADALRLPFADGVFDAACIGFGLRNFVDRDRGLAEMARVVRPGGRVAVLEFSQPRQPVIRRLYDLYAFAIMPRVGRWISGSDAYLYLSQSVREFLTPSELVHAMERAGLVNVGFSSLTFGVVCLHMGTVD